MRSADRLKVTDKTNALTGIGLDQNLILAAVAYGFPRGGDARAERRFRHDASVPYRGNEIVSAHNAIAVLQQIKQKVENLRLHRNRFGVARELALVTIENAASEDKLHRNSLTLEQ